MILKTLNKTVAYSLCAGVIMSSVFAGLEPSYLGAQSASDTVVVSLTVDSGITITSPADTTLAPNLGVAANSAIGSTTWNVKTNDPDGYGLTVRASTTPALRTAGGIGIANYTPAVPGTPDTWDVPGGVVEFGYSAYGTDVSTATWGTGSSCGSSGTPSGTQKYNGFATTTFTVATRNATTTTSGIDTIVCYAVEQDTVYAAAGTYTADITATATVQ